MTEASQVRMAERKHAEDVIDAFGEEHPFYDSAMEMLDDSDSTRSSPD